MSNYDDIQKALSYIDPHDRDVWVQTGYSIKHELGDNGFDVWDQWSQQADNYNSRSTRNVWKSIKNPTRTIASLFHDAKNNGYRPDKPYTPPPPEEQARIKAEREAARVAEEKAQAERHERVKNTAQRIWSSSAPADMNHPYLAAKGITDPASIAGLRQNHYQGDHNLLVPVVYDREIVNMQSINQDGGKRFLSGGQVHGGFAVVGDASKTDQGIVIAEGYATAASIHQAIGKPVIVAFNAGNMVAVSERLAKNLPKDVPVTFAVDNDATQTGMKKALQAASHFDGRAQVIEPEFTMKQIQQYQLENGVDDQGRPKLPSDFNDLHRLAGIDAVRETMEAAFRRPEPEASPDVAPAVEPTSVSPPTTPAPAPQPEEDWAQVIAEEARLSGTAVPAAEVAPSTATAQVVPALQETDMNTQTKPDAVAAETPAATDNSIEFAGRRQTQTPEPYQAVDPEHIYGNGRAADFTPERKHYEADFKHYEVYDPTTNIQYMRRDPKQIQADLDKAGGIGGYDGVTHDGERVAFNKTENGWEAPLSGKAPEPPAQEKALDEPEQTTGAGKKAVTDLNYRIPPESIASRYVVADGKYLSAANMTTVLFVDSGKKISTAKTDTQTINDMLEVAKEKGWDSIKLNGSKEFKSLMYVAAESQGIRTSGYRPTPEDLAMVQRLSQDRSLNSIEASPERAPTIATEPEKVAPAPFPGDKRARSPDAPSSTVAPAAAADMGERIVELGNAPYRHNPENQPSPYLVLEREGKERTVWGVDLPDAMERSGAEVGDRIRLHSLGKQPVELDVPVRNEAGEVTGMEKKEVHRNLFKMEVVGHERGDRINREQTTQPDVEAISKAEKMMAQNHVPSKAAINTSPAADTQLGVPLQAIGSNEIPSEVIVNAGQMKTAALDTRFISAKGNYLDKAAKLSKANKEHLNFHERNVMDTIRGVKGEARTLALINYYEHTSEMMSGTKLKLPKPAQVPNPTIVQNPSRQAERSLSVSQEREQSPEIER